MGQVPGQCTYLIVGRGRLGRHLAHYLDLLGLPQRTWSRADGAPLAPMLASCERVVLAIRDEAIDDFAAAHGAPLLAAGPVHSGGAGPGTPWPTSTAGPGPRWLHCAGGLRSRYAHGAHPLMTFAGGTLYDLETYRAITFVCEAGGPPFTELLPGLPNPSVPLDPALKPRYHALAALAGGGTGLLWSKLFAEFEQHLGLPRAVALPYLRQLATNLASLPEPLTGPLARGERAVVEGHLAALAGDPYATIYRAFAQAALAAPLAGSQPEAVAGAAGQARASRAASGAGARGGEG